MKTIQSSVLSAIQLKFDGMKTVEAFALPSDIIAMMSDPSKVMEAVSLAAKAKEAYDIANKVSPLRSVVLNAVTAALAQLPTEEEAREVARLAVSSWLTAKGLKTLSAAQVARAKDGKPDADDMPLHELQPIARAYYLRTGDKATKDAKGNPLKSVTDIIAHFGLAETSRQAFNLEGKALETIAVMPDAVKPEEKTEAKEESATPAPAPVIPPVLTAAQINNAKNKKR